jgi:hypothetical protein
MLTSTNSKPSVEPVKEEAGTYSLKCAFQRQSVLNAKSSFYNGMHDNYLTIL